MATQIQQGLKTQAQTCMTYKNLGKQGSKVFKSNLGPISLSSFNGDGSCLTSSEIKKQAKKDSTAAKCNGLTLGSFTTP